MEPADQTPPHRTPSETGYKDGKSGAPVKSEVSIVGLRPQAMAPRATAPQATALHHGPSPQRGGGEARRPEAIVNKA